MYEEQSINGILMYRMQSGGEWSPLSHGQLSKKLVEQYREIEKKDEMLLLCRDAIATMDADELGDGDDGNGLIWSIRDEIIHNITQCLLSTENKNAGR